MKYFFVFTITLTLPWLVLAAPQLKRLREFKPTNPSEAFNFHQTLLTERIERIEQNTVIPEDKKLLIIDDLTAESEWLQTKRQQLQAAATTDERLAIRQEIVSHVQSVREERKQTLAESVALSGKSPKELAEQIGERFTSISERLVTAGQDTSTLNQTITDYQTAVTALNDAYSAVQTDKSIETLTVLRDSISAVRQAASTVRNAIQSIVEEAK